MTFPPTGEFILTIVAERERWDAYNKQPYSVLFLSSKGAVNSFFVRFAGKPDSRQQPDGQVAGKAMIEKYLNSSMQWWRIFMRKLNGMVMIPNQEPDESLTEVVQQRNELEHMGESFTEARILDVTVRPK